MSNIKITHKPFITLWNVQGSNNTVELTLDEGSDINGNTIAQVKHDFTVDWGDGVIEDYDDSDRGSPISHTYSSDGQYKVSLISDTAKGQKLEHIGFREASTAELLGVKQWGTIEWKEIRNLFADDGDALDGGIIIPDTGALQYKPSGSPNLSFVDSLDGLLFFFESGFQQPIKDWDVSNITSMTNMLRNTQRNFDVTPWDVSNVEMMAGLFRDASSFNRDISEWRVSNVKSMFAMFLNASSFNQNLGKWDVSGIVPGSSPFPGTEGMNSMFNDSGMTDENAAKTVAGWINPEYNFGGNSASDLPTGVSLGMGDNDYSNFSNFSVSGINASTGQTVTVSGDEAVRTLCQDRNWSIDIQNPPAECS